LIYCCVDIANHIIASENYRFPRDNADSFVILIEERVLAPGARDALQAMACFRNRLVHLSCNVDDERVYAYLQEVLSDIARFGRPSSAASGDTDGTLARTSGNLLRASARPCTASPPAASLELLAEDSVPWIGRACFVLDTPLGQRA